MSDLLEQKLAARMAAFAAGVEVGRPDLAGAERTVRRQRRVRAGVAAGTALAVVAAAVIGVVTVAGHGPAHHVQPAAPGGTSAGSPLPGFTELASVHVPANLGVFGESASGGNVWAVGSDPTNNEPLLMHAHDGGTLSVVRAFPYGDVSDIRVVVRGGLAVAVSTENDVTGVKQDPYLRVYDARTGAVRSEVDLATAYGANGAYLTATQVGGPVALLLTKRAAGGRLDLATAVVLPDGSVTDLSPYVLIPANLLQDGNSSPLFMLNLVVAEDGVARYAFIGFGVGSVSRLDLRTGVVQKIVIDAAANDSAGGLQAQAEGVVAGRVIYQSAAGLAVGAIDSPTATTVAGTGFELASASLEVVAGQVYSVADGTNDLTSRQLDPTTLTPVGPTVTQQLEGGGAVSYDGLVAGVQYALDRGTGVGGTLAVYGAS